MPNITKDKLSASEMPDISVQTSPETHVHLDRVGMRQVEIPVKVAQGGVVALIPAKIDAFVSLDRAEARGIHMSRLYRGARDFFASEALNFNGLGQLLKGFLTTHADLSVEASIRVSLQMPVQRKALKSEETGWRYYPVTFEAQMSEDLPRTRFHFEVMYSSTCPCSAALARQLIQERFASDFAGPSVKKDEIWAWLGTEVAMQGVPHAQRSRAKICVEFSAAPEDPFALIDMVERALGTPVQAAVKREDEQEFGRLNAQNLMFCEDAGRRLKAALEALDFVKDYRVEVIHEESLHPHDAVAIAVKGIPGGMQPGP